MRIGLDFDNTIVRYDELFHRCAIERNLVPVDTPVSKAAVREYLWGLPDGNTPWTELQGIVYGERMSEAKPCPGVMDFFAFCRDRGIRVLIVSHKIEFPALGPRVNMRKAALLWIEKHCFYGTGQGGLGRGDVYFESSRTEKLERIAKLGCTHFIDDLPEVLADPVFPKGVEKILYAGDRHVESQAGQGIKIFSSWPEIVQYFREIGSNVRGYGTVAGEVSDL